MSFSELAPQREDFRDERFVVSNMGWVFDGFCTWVMGSCTEDGAPAQATTIPQQQFTILQFSKLSQFNVDQ